MSCFTYLVVALTFGLGHAVELGGCNWVEVHPTAQPRVLQMCHRFYQPRILHANRINTFLLYASATPCVLAPTFDCPVVEENWQSKLPPPAFYKVSLRAHRSFAHSVDMEPAGQDLYTFKIVPLETGAASLILHLDFDECQGRDMLGLTTVDFVKALFPTPWPQCYLAPSHPNFHGCRRSVFQEVASFRVQIDAEPLTQAPACDWSRYHGAWYQVPHTGWPDHWKPAHCARNTTTEAQKRPENETKAVCVIGDSNVRTPWKYLVDHPNKPPHYEDVFCSGGGMESDIAHGMLACGEDPENTIPPSQFMTTPIKRRNGIKYALKDLEQTGDLSGLVNSILTFEQNPWDACFAPRKPPGPKPDTVIFHIGSHNCGLSAKETRLAIFQTVERFVKWDNPMKCLIVVSSPDMWHESIDPIKFPNQSHFRNSFRINSLNNAARDAIEELKSLRRQLGSHHRHSPGKESQLASASAPSNLNFHFLDTFHLSLGLHFNGHTVLDPVHFKTDTYKQIFAEMWQATADLCGT